VTKNNPQQLEQAAALIQAGGLIAYPTEAVFGLGCDPRNSAAVTRLLKLKQRSPDKGLILISADFQQLQVYLKPLDDEVNRRIQTHWPGPHTWLLPAAKTTPKWLTGQHNTLAVRVTAHPIAAALCQRVGAIVSSSANPSGAVEARSAAEVRGYFKQQIDLIMDAEVGGEKQPSSIRDGLSGHTVRP